MIGVEAVVYIRTTLIYLHIILFANHLICNITSMTRQTLLDFDYMLFILVIKVCIEYKCI